jgi:hypothetical protein
VLPSSATPHPRSDGATLRLYASGRSSASYRVRIALHHKQLPFELVPVSTRTGEQRSREHRARNPMGQVPVLAVEDTGGGVVHLSQSLAPSIADVCLVPQLHSAGRYDVPLFGLETLLTIGQRCRELPGWERALPDHQPDTASG